MAVYGNPQLTYSHGHIKPITTYRTIPSEKDLKISQRAPSTTKEKRAMGKEDVSSKSPSSVWRPQIQRDLKSMELLPEEEGLPAPHQVSQCLGPASKR